MIDVDAVECLNGTGTMPKTISSLENRLCVGIVVTEKKYVRAIEPLLADMGELDLRGIHWLIIGGVSGISKGTIAELGLNQKDFEQWVLNIIKQGRKAGCKIFYKQDFGFRPQTEPFLKGRQYLEFPL